MRGLPTRDEPVNTPERLKLVKLSHMEDFKTLGDPKLEFAKKMAQEFVGAVTADPHRGQYALSLLGNSGVGKTFLAKCIANELGRNQWGKLDRIPNWVTHFGIEGAEVQFRDFRRVSDALKSGEYSIVQTLAQPFLLILDDIGADHDPNGFVASKLDQLIRARRGKWTVITCNLPLAGIAEKLDQRIASFLIRDGNKAVEIETKDYSLRKAA